mgnify:CR=1 FL=1
MQALIEGLGTGLEPVREEEEQRLDESTNTAGGLVSPLLQRRKVSGLDVSSTSGINTSKVDLSKMQSVSLMDISRNAFKWAENGHAAEATSPSGNRSDHFERQTEQSSASCRVFMILSVLAVG